MPAFKHFCRSPSSELAVIRDDPGVPLLALDRPQIPGRFVAVQFRHLAIHEDEVVARAGEFLEGAAAILHHVGHVAEFLQLEERHLLVHRIVFGDEDAEILDQVVQERFWLFAQGHQAGLDFPRLHVARHDEAEAVKKLGLLHGLREIGIHAGFAQHLRVFLAIH